jgi:dTDP-4-dehydrorhamnose 3,5-epimerase
MRGRRVSRFTVTELMPDGPRLVVRHPLADARGVFARLFCDEELAGAGWTGPVRQANHSVTRRAGTIRGMHFQHPPHAEAKLVMCLRGAVCDVAVDVRASSPNLLRWVMHELSAENGAAMLIPPGFAHGFQTLDDDVELLYFHSAPHVPDAEDGLHPLDPRLAIPWPHAVTVMSERDAARAHLAASFEGVRL